MYKDKLVQLMQKIQLYVPREFLELSYIEPVTPNDLKQYLSRALETYSPVFLPVFTHNGNLIAVHLSPKVKWEDSIWVRLDHEEVLVRLLASRLKYLPYSFLIEGYCDIDEVWESLLAFLDKVGNPEIPDKEYLKKNIDDGFYEIPAKYDHLNGTIKLSAVSDFLEAEEAKEPVEKIYRELPDDTLVLAATAMLRSDLNYGDPVSLALKVIHREVPHGFYMLLWAGSLLNVGLNIWEHLFSIALPGLESNSPLFLLKDKISSDDEDVANILRQVATEFQKTGNQEQALIQLRNGAALASNCEILSKEWCLALAQQAERVEPGCAAATLAYCAAEVVK